MGSSPSKKTKPSVIGSDLPGLQVSHDDPEVREKEEREQRIRIKLRAYAQLMKGSPNVYNLFYHPNRRRQELHKFVSTMRRKSELDWENLKQVRMRQEREEAMEAGLPAALGYGSNHHSHRRRSQIEFQGVSNLDAIIDHEDVIA